MPMTVTNPDLLRHAEALVASITPDDSGTNGQGGNGGLISRETIRKTDALRMAIYEAKRQERDTDHG